MNSDFSKIVFAVMVFAMHFCGFCIAALENTFQVVQPVLNEQSEMTQAEKSEKSEKNQASESGEKVLPEKTSIHAEKSDASVSEKSLKNSYGNFVYSDSQGSLRKFSTDEYGFFMVNSSEEGTFFEDSYEGKTVRRIYDASRNLVSKEWWSIGKSYAESKLEKKEDFFYASGGKRPVRSLNKNFLDNTTVETLFGENGKKIFQKKTFDSEKIASMKTKATGKDKTVLEETWIWKYDYADRLIEYEKISTLASEKKIAQKKVFSYDSGGEEPDFQYYENGVIRVKRIYSGLEEYVETAFFDKGFSVETLYRQGKKIEALQKLNGRLQNKVVYEK